MRIMSCMTRIILIAVFVLSLFSGCGKAPFGKGSLTNEGWKYHSFRDIPGVTKDEIRNIEALRGQTGSFVYGMVLSTVTFYNHDGDIQGFSALFCDWLTDLFGILFKPAIYDWSQLTAMLESGEIDFTGELSATAERRKTYTMTDAIAEQLITAFRIAGSEPLPEIVASRKPRYAFPKGTVFIDQVRAAVDYDYELVVVSGYQEGYAALKSGDADAYFMEESEEAAFDAYGDVVAEDFYPMLINPVALSTRNDTLVSIITVVQKARENGADQYLSDMYEAGHRQYLANKLYKRLNEEERAYIRSRPVVRMAAEGGNYPISFYNTHDGEWQGIAYDILRQTEAMTGIVFETVNARDAAWSDLLQMTESGEVSMVADLPRTDGLKDRFLWPKSSYILERMTLLSKSDFHDIQNREIMDLRVGMVRNKIAAEVFPKWFPNHPNTTSYKNSDDIIGALVNGEVDVIMVRLTRLLAMTNYHELSGYKANYVFDSVFETSFGFNKEETVLCSIIDKAMNVIDVDKISSSWQLKTYDYRTALERARLPWLIGVSALLLCILILMFVLFQRKRSENEKTETQAHWYEAILDAIPFPISVTNPDKILTFINAAAMDLMGKTREDITDLTCDTLNTDICNTDKCCVACMKRGEKQTFFSLGGFSYQVNIETLTDINGNPAGLIRIVQDITAIEESVRQQAEAARIQSEHKRTRLILDAMPLACFFLDTNFQLSDINEAAVKMFELNEKDISITNFWDYSPEYQPDGSLSFDSASAQLKKAFDEGKSNFKWTHRLLDGTPIPAEITLARIDLGDTSYVAGYMRDLREHNKMMSEIGQRDNLLNAGNRSALFLLGATDERTLDSSIIGSMEAIGNCVVADRVQLWRREPVDGVLYLNMIYEWTNELGGKKTANAGAKIPWDSLAEYHDLFRRGGVVNGPLSSLPDTIQAALGGRGIKSILSIPMILDDKIWGLFSLIDCTRERGFSEDEANAMRSMGLMILNSMLRNETDRKLVAAMTEAQSANQAKSLFLANMSHEIRTPMNTIMGITEILMQSEHLNSGTEEGLNRIYNSCNLLLGIINDILDFSRIEAGKLEIISEPYYVASLINDTTRLNLLRFAGSPIEFRLQIGKDVPETLVGDELRIKQVLNNLLSNAFKYTHQGEIVLSVSVETGEDSGGAANGNVLLVFVVRDTGQGMTAEQIGMLFDRFTRFNMGTNRKIEGAGLGMSIAQGLVNMMNGSMHVESEPGKGSTFIVILPQRLDGLRSVISKEIVENLTKNRVTSAAQVKRAQIIRKYMPYGNVLIVDDTEANLYVAKLLMTPYGMKIDTAESGYEAVDKIKGGALYDIIFMDHMMPGMDGMEAVKIIRELGYLQPIIALTANAVVGQADIFLANGFDDFIPKPMDMRVLDMALKKYIYDKQTPEVLAMAQAKKEEIEAQAAATAAEAEQPPSLDSTDFQSADTLPFDLPGLNVGRGLALFDGELDTYLSALRSFTKNVPEVLGKLHDVTEENLPEYAINVHALKSISGWICADGIQARAASLEALAKAGNLIGVITLNKALMDETEAFMSDLRVQLEDD